MMLDKRPDCAKCGSKESALVVMYGRFFCGQCTADYVNSKKEQEQNKFERWVKDAGTELPEV